MKRNELRTTFVLSVAVLSAALHAGQSTGPTDTIQPFQQLIPFNDSTNSVTLTFSGSNASTHGLDYLADGVTLNYQSPAAITLTNPTSTFTPVTFSPGSNVQQYVKETVTTTVNGVPTTTEKNMYRQDVVNGQTQWVEVKPGLVFDKVTVGSVDGTTNTAGMGVSISGQHVGNQLTGGAWNEQPTDFAALEGLIAAVKGSATATMDLSNGAVTGSLGTMANPAIVYATGRRNANGTISESDVHWSGQFSGAGIMVIEIDDPNTAQFVMSGQSVWQGLLIVVTNKIPTGNKQPMAFVGGGQDQHVVGGAIIYTRNIKRTPTSTQRIFGQSMVKLAGNGNIRYSRQALNAFNEVAPTVMQVRSWRRLAENE